MKRYAINPRLLESEPMQRCQLGQCKAACCLYGVWLDSNEADNLRQHASIISPHMEEGYSHPDSWLDGHSEKDPFSPSGIVRHSAVVPSIWHYGGSACVFLRSDYKCALQVAGETQGCHPWTYKPRYCILHPLDLDDEGRLTLDRTHLMLEEEGSCLVPADHPIPLWVTFEPELRYILGNEVFDEYFGGMA